MFDLVKGVDHILKHVGTMPTTDQQTAQKVTNAVEAVGDLLKHLSK